MASKSAKVPTLDRDALHAFVRWIAEMDAKAWLVEQANNQKATAPSQPEETPANSRRS